MKQAADAFAHGDHRTALTGYEEACRINPDSAEAWCNRAGASFVLGQRAEAANFYQRALAIAPPLVEARLGLVRIALTTSHLEEARMLLKALPADLPARAVAESLYLQGILAEHDQDPSAAERLYQASVQAGHAPAHKALQRLLLQMDKPRELARLVSCEPNSGTPRRPAPELTLHLLQHLPSARSRWLFFCTGADYLPDCAEWYECAAGVFLRQKEFAYAARTAARARTALGEDVVARWPELRSCSWS